MKTAILTVGMRGAGKTHFCKAVHKVRPDIHFFCRDDYFNEHFGHFTFDPYSGEGPYAAQCFWQFLIESINQNEGIFLIDYWTGYVETRVDLINRLYIAGAEKVIAWFFNTPLKKNIEWFIEREFDPNKKWESKENLADRCESDYNLFRKNIDDILDFNKIDPAEIVPNSDLHPRWDKYKFHFDQVITINQTQENSLKNILQILPILV